MAFRSNHTENLGPILRDGTMDMAEATRGPQPPGFAPDLLDRFYGQVRRRAEHPAVVAPDGTLTYRDLARATTALANRLREAGVGEGARIAVSMPRGAREVTSLLAALQIGAAYLPIDASHPVDRIRLTLADALPQVLVAPTSSTLVSVMPDGALHVPFDELVFADDAPGATATSVPAAATFDARPAYVLFTSGSTGRPKGVEVPRGALGNFLRSMERCPGLGETERVLAITTTTFDIAGLELFLPLWVGATTIIADRETTQDPWLLIALIEREHPSMIQATPATWRLLLEAGWQGSPNLKLLCGGEPLTESLAKRLLATGGELWNMYGPTETTIWSTMEKIAIASSPITIGRPIDHTFVYVLDENQKRVSPGTVGELFIGGRGVACGYLNRPQLTAERFVSDPYGGAGERMYRTGDLGRLRPDGRFECLGRIDHQVKIRGFRIETGEVESVLRSVAGVNEAIVTAIKGDEDSQLCAYWTGQATRKDLSEGAKTRLPTYMIPAVFVHLESFPLNTNGKVDRSALPVPVLEGSTQGSGTVENVSPWSTSAEQFLAETWGRLLDRVPTARDDNFFTLGGDSVQAVVMLNTVAKAGFGQVRVASFMHEPTMAGLARWLEKCGSEAVSDDESLVVEIQDGPGIPLWLIHPVGGHVSYGELIRKYMRPRQPILGIQSRGVDGRAEPLSRIEEMSALYFDLIRKRHPHGPYLIAGSSMGGLIALEVAARLEKAGADVPLLALLDTGTPNYPRPTSRVSAFFDNVWEIIRQPEWKAIKNKAGRVWGRIRGRHPEDSPAPVDPFESIGVDDVLLRAIGTVTRLNQAAMKGYVLPPYGRPLTLLRASQRPRWPGWSFKDPQNGLGEFVKGRIEVVPFSCSHLEMLDEPHVADVARWLQARIDDLALATEEASSA